MKTERMVNPKKVRKLYRQAIDAQVKAGVVSDLVRLKKRGRVLAVVVGVVSFAVGFVLGCLW